MSLTKKPVANLLNILLSLSEIPGGYSLFLTYCLMSKYHGSDVNLSRSRSFDTSYEDLDDATSRRKISQGRRHKDYLDKSEIGSTRNSERNSHQILSNAKIFLLLKTKTNTYSFSEQKDKNRHGPSKQFGPKLK